MKPEEMNSDVRKKRFVKGLKLGIFIEKLNTFRDIKQGRFRRIFNRHMKFSGI